MHSLYFPRVLSLFPFFIARTTIFYYVVPTRTSYFQLRIFIWNRRNLKHCRFFEAIVNGWNRPLVHKSYKQKGKMDTGNFTRKNRLRKRDEIHFLLFVALTLRERKTLSCTNKVCFYMNMVSFIWIIISFGISHPFRWWHFSRLSLFNKTVDSGYETWKHF